MFGKLNLSRRDNLSPGDITLKDKSLDDDHLYPGNENTIEDSLPLIAGKSDITDYAEIPSFSASGSVKNFHPEVSGELCEKDTFKITRKAKWEKML